MEVVTALLVLGVYDPGLALFFVETTSHKIGHILHSAASTNILKIDGGYFPAIFRKTKVSQLGVAVHQCLKFRFL